MAKTPTVGTTVPPKAAVAPKGATKAKPAIKAPGGVPATVGATGATVPPSKATGGKNARTPGNRRPVEAADQKQRPAKPEQPKRRGALDLAAELLQQSPQPMTAAALVTSMLERKLWHTAGKTPAATLYSAIIREIGAKGKDSRFVKTARGLFATNPNAPVNK